MARVPPHVAQILPTRLVCGFGVAEAPIVDGLQLTEIPDQDDGEVPERVVVRIEGGLAEEAPLGLLQSEVHACEEGAADEGDLVHDQQHDAPPLLLELPKRIERELVLPCCFGKDTEA